MPMSRQRGSAVRRWPFTRKSPLVSQSRLKGGAGKVATSTLMLMGENGKLRLSSIPGTLCSHLVK